MRKALNIITSIVLALSIMLGIATPVLGQRCKCSERGTRIIQPTSVTIPTGNGLWVRRDGSQDPEMTGPLGVTADGIPATFERTTDAASNALLGLYSNRATPTSLDEGYTSLYLNDDGSTKVEFARFTWMAFDATAASKDTNLIFSGYKDNNFIALLSLMAGTDTALFNINVRLPVGTVSAPALRGPDADTGFYWGPGGGTSARIAVDGADVLTCTAGAVTAAQPVHAPAGTKTLPGLAFDDQGDGSGNWDTGFFAQAAKGSAIMHATVNDTDVASYEESGITFFQNLNVDGNVVLGKGASGNTTTYRGMDSWTSQIGFTWNLDGNNIWDNSGFATNWKGGWNYTGLLGADYNPGSDTDTDIVTIGVTETPRIFWNESDDSFESTKPIITPTARSPIVVVFSGTANPYFSTTNAAYTTVAIFPFGGTTALGTPSAIKAIGFKDANPTSWDLRVLDITNTTTIAEATGNTGTAPQLVSAGALSNLPAGEAMFEFQIKRAGGVVADNVFAHSASIIF